MQWPWKVSMKDWFRTSSTLVTLEVPSRPVCNTISGSRVSSREKRMKWSLQSSSLCSSSVLPSCLTRQWIRTLHISKKTSRNLSLVELLFSQMPKMMFLKLSVPNLLKTWMLSTVWLSFSTILFWSLHWECSLKSSRSSQSLEWRIMLV